MTLTEKGKDYIATHFGLDYCFVPEGLSWIRVDIDGEETSETGGTAILVIRLWVTIITDYILLDSTKYTYADLKAANDGYDLDLDDLTWIAEHESGETQYCTTPPPPCSVDTDKDTYQQGDTVTITYNNAPGDSLLSILAYPAGIPVYSWIVTGSGTKYYTIPDDATTGTWEASLIHVDEGCAAYKYITVNPKPPPSEKTIGIAVNKFWFLSLDLTESGIEEITPDTKYNIIYEFTNSCISPFLLCLTIIHSDDSKEEIYKWERLKRKGQIKGEVEVVSGTVAGEEIIRCEIRRILKKEIDFKIKVS